jgi:hypothetical protein
MNDKMAGRLVQAILNLTVQLRRFNDFNEPEKARTSKREAELGKASYGDPVQRRQNEELHAALDPGESPQLAPKGSRRR